MYASKLINQLTLSQRGNAIGKDLMTTDHEVKSYNSVYDEACIVWEKLRWALSDNWKCFDLGLKPTFSRDLGVHMKPNTASELTSELMYGLIN